MRQKKNTATEPVLLKTIQIFNNKLPLKSNEEIKKFEDWLKGEYNYKFMVILIMVFDSLISILDNY